MQKTHHRSLLDSEYEKYDLTWRQNIIDLVDGRGVLLLRNPYKASQENAALYDDRVSPGDSLLLEQRADQGPGQGTPRTGKPGDSQVGPLQTVCHREQ